MRARGGCFYLSVKFIVGDTVCSDPQVNRKTKKHAGEPLSSCLPLEADMISCYPCFPPSIKPVSTMSMRPGDGRNSVFFSHSAKLCIVEQSVV